VWYEQRKDAELFIKSCWVCQKCRLGQSLIDGPGNVTQSLPEDFYGNKYICNWVDTTSGALELTAHLDTTAKSAQPHRQQRVSREYLGAQLN
jgi:hypothetical protein